VVFVAAALVCDSVGKLAQQIDAKAANGAILDIEREVRRESGSKGWPSSVTVKVKA
jgi:hypothetical protein